MHKGQITFSIIVQKILEGYGVAPMNRSILGSGPNVNFTGAKVTGFYGSNLGGNVIPIRVKNKKKKRIKKKKV